MSNHGEFSGRGKSRKRVFDLNPGMGLWDRVDELLTDYDGDLEISVGSYSSWAATLRLTLTDPAERPSRSITFHKVGGDSPEWVTEHVLHDADEALAGTVKPMPVPDWMKE